MKYVIYILVLSATISCVEPFEFTIDGNTNVLIVDATLTNEQKEHQVILTWSRGLSNNQSQDTTHFVSGAAVWLETNQGEVISYSETSEGIFKTDATFAGQIGESYTLNIETSDGRLFQSSNEELLPGIEMDSIYARYDERLSSEETRLLKGIQFFVDTRHIDFANMNFRYEYAESYEIISPLESQYVMDYPNEQIIPRTDPINVCYKTIKSNTILTSSTNGLDQPVIAEFPIRYALNDEPQLRNDYMISVKQYTISSNAYQFYKNLKENNESAGSFFDKQKGTVPGNIFEVGNSETLVMGFFEVAGVSVKRRKYENADFSRIGLRIHVNTDFCETPISVGLDTLFSAVPPNTYNILTYIPSPNIGDPPLGVYVNPITCSDCRGVGSLVKPQFWD